MGTAAATSFTVNVVPYSITGVLLGIKANLFVLDTYMVVNPEPWNAPLPIDVTESGMVIDVKPLQK